MTPSVSADVNTSGDMNSLIDSSIDSVNTAESAAPASPEIETPSEESEPAEVPEVPETETEAPAPPEEEEVDPNDDLSKPDRMSKDGKLWYFRPSRVAAFQAAHKAWSAVQDAVPGATIESIKAMYETSAGAEQLMADVDSGAFDRVLPFLAQDPVSTSKLADQVLPFLAKANPQALQQMENRVMQVQVKRMYERAQQNGNERLFKIAQNLDYQLNGKFLQPGQVQDRNALAEREAAQAAREQAFQRQVQEQQEEKIRAWAEDTRSLADKSVDEAISAKIPDGVKKAFEGKFHMKWIATTLRDKVAEAMQNNPSFQRQYDATIARAQARPSEQSRGAVISMRRQFAEQVIAKNIKAVIEEATGSVMSASAAAHNKLAAAAAKREPANAGTPVNGTSIPKGVKEAKDMDSVFKALGW